jgi:2-amino-4-hydroxy-6-hydroxymethyldihydropteridine diphosphokinase
MVTVYLGLGGNLGDRAGQLQRAVAALATRLTITAVSSLYESAPCYVLDQPAFLNMALAGETTLTPQALMALAKDLESRLGRTPTMRNGPRQIDIDLLFYGDAQLQTPDLTLPHPRLGERGFVLVPLAEIAPDWRHPVSRRPIRQLLADLDDPGSVVRLPSPRPAAWLDSPPLTPPAAR